MDFLNKKLDDSSERQKNIFSEAGQPNPYITFVAALERALHEGSAISLPEPLQTQLQANREQRMVASIQRTDVVVLSRLSSSPSPKPSSDSPVIATPSSTVPSTVPRSVLVSSPVTALRVQTLQPPLAGSPEVLSLQLEPAERDPFAHEMRTMSTSKLAATTETMSRAHRKELSEVTIPLDVKETKRPVRPRKAQKRSGRCPHEEYLHTRHRDDSDSTGEGEGKANDGKGSRSGNGN